MRLRMMELLEWKLATQGTAGSCSQLLDHMGGGGNAVEEEGTGKIGTSVEFEPWALGNTVLWQGLSKVAVESVLCFTDIWALFFFESDFEVGPRPEAYPYWNVLSHPGKKGELISCGWRQLTLEVNWMQIWGLLRNTEWLLRVLSLVPCWIVAKTTEIDSKSGGSSLWAEMKMKMGLLSVN